MSTDRFNPEPTPFTPAPGDADLTADPTTGTGPGGVPMGADDAPAGDVNATAGGDAPTDDGPDGDTGHGPADPGSHDD